MSAIFKRHDTHQDSCAPFLPSKSSLSCEGARQNKKEEMEKEQTKLTEHFTLEELCATSRKQYQEKNLAYGKTIKNRLEDLAYFLEDVRKVCDSPLLVTSAVRCPELNAAVGGVKTSQHLSGHAADIIPQKNGSVQDHFGKIYNSHLIYDEMILEEVDKKIWIHISFVGMKGRRKTLFYNGRKYIEYKGDKNE